MHTGDEQKFSGDIQVTDAHYLTLATIVEQAKSLGLELEGLMSQAPGASASLPAATLGDWIQQARRKLYLQMMEFEMLDMDLAELHAELQATPKKTTRPAVTLTLV